MTDRPVDLVVWLDAIARAGDLVPVWSGVDVVDRAVDVVEAIVNAAGGDSGRLRAAVVARLSE